MADHVIPAFWTGPAFDAAIAKAHADGVYYFNPASADAPANGHVRMALVGTAIHKQTHDGTNWVDNGEIGSGGAGLTAAQAASIAAFDAQQTVGQVDRSATQATVRFPNGRSGAIPIASAGDNKAGLMSNADKVKLDGVPGGLTAALAAKADQTDLAAEVTARTAGDAALDGRVTTLENAPAGGFTTGAQIRTALDGEPDTNIYDDAAETAVNGLAAAQAAQDTAIAAKADQTALAAEIASTDAEQAAQDALIAANTAHAANLAAHKGITHLSVGNVTPSALEVESDSGNNATLPAAGPSANGVGGTAGLLLATDKEKLDSLDTIATIGVATFPALPAPAAAADAIYLVADATADATNSPAAGVTHKYATNQAKDAWVYLGAITVPVIGPLTVADRATLDALSTAARANKIVTVTKDEGKRRATWSYFTDDSGNIHSIGPGELPYYENNIIPKTNGNTEAEWDVANGHMGFLILSEPVTTIKIPTNASPGEVLSLFVRKSSSASVVRLNFDHGAVAGEGWRTQDDWILPPLLLGNDESGEGNNVSYRFYYDGANMHSNVDPWNHSPVPTTADLRDPDAVLAGTRAVVMNGGSPTWYACTNPGNDTYEPGTSWVAI